MSYDIKIQNPCDHKINWMREYLEPDRRTVYLTYPVASLFSFSIRVNNTVIDQIDYSVKTDKKNLSLVVYSYVIFEARVKHNDPLIEVNYVTFPVNCPKCKATKTIDDFRYNSAGDIITTNRERLLLQNIEKVIITKQTSNAFHGWYGTGLHNLIGKKITDRPYLKSKIIETVRAAIDNFSRTQKNIVGSGRKTDPGELFGSVKQIAVNETPDPNSLEVLVSFTAQSGNIIDYSQMIELNEVRERLAFK